MDPLYKPRSDIGERGGGNLDFTTMNSKVQISPLPIFGFTALGVSLDHLSPSGLDCTTWKTIEAASLRVVRRLQCHTSHEWSPWAE